MSASLKSEFLASKEGLVMKQLKRIALGCLLFVLTMLVLAGCGTKDNQINEVPTEDTYGYVNPES